MRLNGFSVVSTKSVKLASVTGSNLPGVFTDFNRLQKSTVFKLPGVVVAIVVKGISNANLSSVEPFGVRVNVDNFNRKHFMGFAQIKTPPGADVVVCVSAGALFPLAVTISIDGIVCKSKSIQR